MAWLMLVVNSLAAAPLGMLDGTHAHAMGTIIMVSRAPRVVILTPIAIITMVTSIALFITATAKRCAATC